MNRTGEGQGECARVDVRGDGRIILFKRTGLKKPVWQARIRVPNATGYRFVSTKTPVQREAERFALDLYEQLYLQVKGGGSLRPRTFRQVFEEWQAATATIALSRQGRAVTPTVERVKRYALDYFGARRMREISSREIEEYWLWRKRNFARKPPTSGTLQRERTCLAALFRFAFERGHIEAVPALGGPRAAVVRRSTFTLDEWRQLIGAARQWVREGEKKATARDRMVARESFLVLANTGMRVGELRHLRWSDLRTVQTTEGPRLVAWVRGKTGSRECVFQSGSDAYVKRLYDLRTAELGKPPERDSLVVCHRDGSAIRTMRRSFASLLEFAKLPVQRDGMNRTIYSLRHFYATQRLSHETSPFLLAKQMGTSVEMLERFYGQTVTSSLAAQVSKGNQTRGCSAASYPFE